MCVKCTCCIYRVVFGAFNRIMPPARKLKDFDFVNNNKITFLNIIQYVGSESSMVGAPLFPWSKKN